MSATSLPPLHSNTCGLCGKSGQLQQCSGCQVMFYCSRQHKGAHRPKHMYLCSYVLSMRINYTSLNELFQQNRRYGLGIPRDYMASRLGLALALGDMNTKQAILEQLHHLHGMLLISPRDLLGVQVLIPGLLLRLDLDQECYKFIKWYPVHGPAALGPWFRDSEHANILEDVSYLCTRDTTLSYLVCTILLKIKLAIDLTGLQNATDFLGAVLPLDVLNCIRDHIPRSPIVARNRAFLECPDHTATIEILTGHVRELVRAVESREPGFCSALLTLPETRSSNSIKDALQSQYHHSWSEIPGALEFLAAVMEE